MGGGGAARGRGAAPGAGRGPTLCAAAGRGAARAASRPPAGPRGARRGAVCAGGTALSAAPAAPAALPYDGDVQAAMRNQDRAAIRQIMKARGTQETRRASAPAALPPPGLAQSSSPADGAAGDAGDDFIPPVVAARHPALINATDAASARWRLAVRPRGDVF